MSRKLEHPLDRLKRLGRDVVLMYETQDSVGYRFKGRGHVNWLDNPVTELNTCQVCGKTSTPKKVSRRNDVYRWNCEHKDWNAPNKYILCTGCWNKVKPLVKREREAEEMRHFINRLNKEISYERKNQNDRRNAKLSSHDDGRGKERRP